VFRFFARERRAVRTASGVTDVVAAGNETIEVGVTREAFAASPPSPKTVSRDEKPGAYSRNGAVNCCLHALLGNPRIVGGLARSFSFH
jgi:hypothetical protein